MACGCLVAAFGLAVVGPAFAVAQPFTFAVLGDMPYAREREMPDGRKQEAHFHDLINAINAAKPAFTIHVGDFKPGSSKCDKSAISKAVADFNRFDHAVIYTPGDNEWTDCHRYFRQSGENPLPPGRLEQIQREALGELREHFFKADHALGREGGRLPLLRQVGGHPENVTFEHAGVRFGTVHIVGSNDNFECHREEWASRRAANTAWLDRIFTEARNAGDKAVVLAFQADVFATPRHCLDSRRSGGAEGTKAAREMILEKIAGFDGPVLLVYGDEHKYCTAPLGSAGTRRHRLMTFGDSEINGVLVTVDAAGTTPFSFRAVMGGAPPAGCGY